MFVKNQIVAFAPETLVNGVQLASSARVESVIHSYRDMLYIFETHSAAETALKRVALQAITAMKACCCVSCAICSTV